MGNEVNGTVRMGKVSQEGKILLETSEIIFRGPDFRAKIPFAEIREVAASDAELRIKTKSGMTIFEVGDVAEKWREKILHPKARIEKLGVKAGMRVSLLGDAEAAFADELRQSKAAIVNGSPDGGAELIFLFVDQLDGLSQVLRLAKKMKGAAGLWIAYPKGKKEITEVDVIGAGRKAGLKNVKVVGFSETYTALKFVIPLEKR
jgi:hypothetical protein